MVLSLRRICHAIIIYIRIHACIYSQHLHYQAIILLLLAWYIVQMLTQFENKQEVIMILHNTTITCII